MLKPCKNCGSSDRNASSNCRICAKNNLKKFKELNPDKIKLYKANYEIRNREKVNETQRSWRKKNSEKAKEIVRRYKSKNSETISIKNKNYREKNKIKERERHRVYLQNNLAKHAAYQKKRQGYKSKATPSWLTNDQVKDMISIYDLAYECTLITGDKYEVDHIIPLKGKTVCGLHVPWNLQVLPSDINRRKSNKILFEE